MTSSGQVINLTVTGEAPPSHDPYMLEVVVTGTGRIEGRRIDVPHLTQGGVEVTVTPNAGFTINSVQDLGPVLGISMELIGTDPYVVRIRGDASSSARTFRPHFTVVYTEDSSGTRHMQREDYTLVIDNNFYAGVLSGQPTAIASFATGDNRGAIANGKSVMVTNSLGGTGTLYLAIPDGNYNADSFEITTNGYPIAIEALDPDNVPSYQIIEVGDFNAGDTLTFVIQGVV